MLWVHELDHTVGRIVSERRRDHLLAQTDRIVAVGPAVGTMVRDRWGVPPSDVTVLPSFADAPDPREQPPTGPHEVVAIGSLTARKAPDLFVAVVAYLARHHGPVDAAWVGGPLDGPTAALVRHDLGDSGAGRVTELVGEVDDTLPWLPADGVLVHVAREDPAPLVVLEAALRAVPVVTWDGGGAAELAHLAGRPDLVVPPGDVAALARRIAHLLDDAGDRARAGAALAAAAKARTTGAVAPRLLDAITDG